MVYDTYWRFAAERQEVFFKRWKNARPPWTSDAILSEYKFTNAYRASDRVSQFLIKDVIYQGEQSEEELFFRTILFKLFNKIETWRLMERMIGALTYSRSCNRRSAPQVMLRESDSRSRGSCSSNQPRACTSARGFVLPNGGILRSGGRVGPDRLRGRLTLGGPR